MQGLITRIITVTELCWTTALKLKKLICRRNGGYGPPGTVVSTCRCPEIV